MALYIVSTPIGNLEDITIRAINILKKCSLIACEDTRHSSIIFKEYNIDCKTLSYNDHNKVSRSSLIIEKLKNGENIALVSDAGTPGIADPAYFLVNIAIENNIDIYPIPGPSAILASLVCSGLPTDRFVFENFVPQKKTKKIKKFQSLTNEERTIILYESPYRIIKTLEILNGVFGNIYIVIAREITKKFETFYRGNVLDVINQLNEKKSVKGEIVLLFNLKHNKIKT